METIKKSVDIDAPKEKVWDVLVNDRYNRIWYSLFSEGTHADTDWKEGSKVVFSDGSHSGLLGKIIKNRPHDELTIKYDGMIINGKEDFESKDALSMAGAVESYRLSEKNGLTALAVDCDMNEDYFDMMSASWDKAMDKIKELSEADS